MLDNVGMFFYKKSGDRYGRNPALRRLDCPVCGFHNHVEQEIQIPIPNEQTTHPPIRVWSYSCMICSHMLTFRQKLEKDHAKDHPSGDTSRI